MTRPAGATSSPPPSSTAAIAGTWSPSTSIATTGARSALTGSRAGSARRAAGGGAPCPAVTPPHTSSSSCARRGVPEDAVPGRVRLAIPRGCGGPADPVALRPRRARRRRRVHRRARAAHWSREFLVWMALLDAPMQVLSPPELVDAARSMVTRLAPPPDRRGGARTTDQAP